MPLWRAVDTWHPVALGTKTRSKLGWWIYLLLLLTSEAALKRADSVATSTPRQQSFESTRTQEVNLYEDIELGDVDAGNTEPEPYSSSVVNHVDNYDTIGHHQVFFPLVWFKPQFFAVMLIFYCSRKLRLSHCVNGYLRWPISIKLQHRRGAIRKKTGNKTDYKVMRE